MEVTNMARGESPSSKAAINAGRWKKGQRNPKGYRRGSKHTATLFAENLLSGEAQGLIRKAVELALSGDVGALKLCLDRILPPLKSRPINFALPTLRTTSDALSALAALVQGTSSGQLLPEELEPLAATIATYIRATEVSMFEDRLSSLEREEKGEAPHGQQPLNGHSYDA
jgi:hypothetical protein